MSGQIVYSQCPECKSVFWFQPTKGRGGEHKKGCTKKIALVKYNMNEHKADQPEYGVDPAILSKIADAVKSDPNILKKIRQLAKF